MRYAPLGHARRMSQFAATMTMLGNHRAVQALRPHARPLILACGLASALLVWYGHKPVLERVRALRQRLPND